MKPPRVECGCSQCREKEKTARHPGAGIEFGLPWVEALFNEVSIWEPLLHLRCSRKSIPRREIVDKIR